MPASGTCWRQATDPEVQRAQRLAQSVRRDTHKMRAFVRFREVAEPEGTRYVAWFEPDHFIVEANAPFFVRRFATMVWSILTPYRSAHWNGEDLASPPAPTARTCRTTTSSRRIGAPITAASSTRPGSRSAP